MDWISGIQRAIDYTEAHLTDEIDYEAVAREAASSVFHFQRMFSMLLGYTLGDYIRMRRLSLAADELHRTDDRSLTLRSATAMTRRRALPVHSPVSTASHRRRRGAGETSSLLPAFP